MKKNNGLPFATGFGDRIGKGQDNVVLPLKDKGRGTLRKDVVVKKNHPKPREDMTREAIEARERGVRYKLKKYELLKFFLGDFVPWTGFALGEEQDGNRKRPKELTIQERLPECQLKDLTQEQLRDPRLIHNLHELFSRLIFMHQMVERVNKEVTEDARIDVRLDLGPISIMARETVELNRDTKIDLNNLSQLSTPNLLVDPQTMRLYCIDFGRGQWSDKRKQPAFWSWPSQSRNDELALPNNEPLPPERNRNVRKDVLEYVDDEYVVADIVRNAREVVSDILDCHCLLDIPFPKALVHPAPYCPPQHA